MALVDIGTGLLLPRQPQISIAPGVQSGMLIDATGEKLAWCGRVFFPARAGTKNVSRVQFPWLTVTKAGGSGLICSLQDVSLTAGPPAQPDGVQDQTVAIAAASVTANSWFRSNPFNASRPVAYGDLLAVVVEFDGGGRLGSDQYTAGGMAVIGGTATPVFGQCISVLNTGSWTQIAQYPVIILEFDDGTFGTLMGSLPYSAVNVHAYNLNTAGADEFAAAIRLPFRCAIDGLWVLATISGGAANYELLLYQGTTVLETVAVDANTIAATAARWFWAPISAQRTLEPNTDYYVACRPTTTNAITCYSMDVANAAFWSLFDGPETIGFASRLDQGAWSATTSTRRFLAGISLSEVEDGAGGVGASIYHRRAREHGV